MLKVAHIVTAYSSVVTILDSKLRILDRLKRLDVNIISSLPDARETRKPAVRHLPVRMHRSIKPLADLSSIWQLYKLLKQERFDVVHSHTAKAGFITAIAARMASVPLICHTYHGLPFFEGQKRNTYQMYHFLEKIACKFRDHIFTQNKRDLPECIKLMGSESSVSYEGNGVDVEFIKQSAKKQLSQALKEYPNKGIRLVLLSRLEPVKRVDDFFKVVDKLKQKGVEVSCVVAGTGVLERQLRAQLIEMQLDDCVNMVGFSDHPHGLIAASDIVVLCSEKEGIPRTIMEAMVLQKPVVATNVAGTEELVIDGETGYLMDVGDIVAITEKVVCLGEKPELREQMGVAGFKRIREYFNEKKIVEFWRDYYLQNVCRQM